MGSVLVNKCAPRCRKPGTQETVLFGGLALKGRRKEKTRGYCVGGHTAGLGMARLEGSRGGVLRRASQ